MKTFYSYLLVLIVLISFGCTQKAVPSEEDRREKLILEVIKSPCYGDCPVYDFRVYSDGIAELDAKNNMNWVGSYKSRLGRAKISHIRKIFQKADYFSFEESYSSPATDLPTTDIYYKLREDEKQVKYYGAGPEELVALVEELVEMVDEIEWKRKVTEM